MLSILLIGVSLSMDALAVSLATGMALRPLRTWDALRMGAYFGAFQCLMPLFGALLGTAVSRAVRFWGPYISFFLLAFIGGRMLLDSRSRATTLQELSGRRMLALAVATSIDALAVGVSFAFLPDVRLLPSCVLIGAVTFVLCAAGALLGGSVPAALGRRATALGGAVLIAIGIKLLLDGFW
ncbi:MAG: manganese efflux pump MntP family protein [Oscillospiraceae bacterium]|nr:manganese efflux pump MntP family protein [Oscillospiraceae bacterium]